MQFISVWNTSLVGFCHLYYLYIQLIYIFVEQFRNRVIYSSRVSPLNPINLLSLSIKLFLFAFLPCPACIVLLAVHFDQCMFVFSIIFCCSLCNYLLYEFWFLPHVSSLFVR